MSLMSRPIPSLLNGVSQQPPSLRKASQCELQVNGYSSLTDGLTKRPPAQMIAALSAGSLGDVHMSVMDFGDNDRFILVLVNNDLYVYDTAGTLQTLAFPDGKGYLAVTDATTDFSVVSVEDVAYVTNKTFLTNNTTTVASGTYKGEVQTFSTLPGGAVNGDVWKIIGDDNVVLTGLYYKWVVNGVSATWQECAYPGTKTTFLAPVMPHKILWDGASTFTFQQETWGIRPAGDLTSLPSPNFLGRAIRDVFFHRNRLGFLTGEYCVLSQSGPDYENFYRQSATAFLDNDRIDVRAANVKLSTLDWAIPFNSQLLMFSAKTQFVMGTAKGQTLTPTSSSIDVATSYASNSVAKPVAVGNSVYFPSESTLFAAIREYSVSDDTEIANTAEDTTAHVPSYIPAGVFQLAVAENDDTLFALTTGNASRIYNYKYYWVDDQKVQSSWSYWQFNTDYDIKGIVVIDSTLYMIVLYNGATHLEAIDLIDDPSLIDLGFTCYLDKRHSTTGIYVPASDYTYWNLPHTISGNTFEVVKGGDWTSSYGALIPNSYALGSATWAAPGDHSAHACYVGLPYEMKYRFSEIFVREGQDADSGSPILDSVLTLRTMSVRYSQTGYLRAEVVPRTGATPYTYVFSGKTIGAVSLVIGTPNISTGTFKFPVAADSRRVTIDLINDSHMPSSLVSAEWAGNFSLKSGRRR